MASSFEEDLLVGLRADEGLATLVGQRGWWKRRTRGTLLPAWTVQGISLGRFYSHAGAAGLANPRLQFDIWAETYLSAVQVKRALIAAIEDLVGNIHGTTAFKGAFLVMEKDWDEPVSLGEGDPVERVTLHFTVWHQPA